MGINGGPANQALCQFKIEAAILPKPINDAAGFAHHLSADAIAGKQEKGEFLACHARALNRPILKRQGVMHILKIKAVPILGGSH